MVVTNGAENRRKAAFSRLVKASLAGVTVLACIAAVIGGDWCNAIAFAGGSYFLFGGK